MPCFVVDKNITDLLSHQKAGGKFVCGGEMVTLVSFPQTNTLPNFPFLGFISGQDQVRQWRYDGFPPPWDNIAEDTRLYAAKEVLTSEEHIVQLTLQRDEAREEVRGYRYALSKILGRLQANDATALSEVRYIFQDYTDLLDE